MNKNTERMLHNVLKIIAMAIVGIVLIAAVAIVFLWPMLLWWHYGQPLSVAVAITIVWIAGNA